MSRTPIRNSSLILTVALAFAVLLTLSPSASAQTESTIFDFTYGSYSGMVLDGTGNMYGTSIVGGTNKAGSVYELSQASGSWQLTTLYSFIGGSDGSQPYSPLTFDSAGNLYGTTLLGGAHNAGVVFKLSPRATGEWQESVLYSFTGLLDGGYPKTGNLVFDKQGNLYGSNVGGGNTATISGGNTGGCGVVFRLSPHANGTWGFKVLHTFTGGWDGVGPAFFTFDKNGTLFGGAAGAWSGFELPNEPGLVFKLAPNAAGTWVETPIYSFKGGNDGGLPGGIVFGSDGAIYGAGADGGTSTFCESGYGSPIGCGVVFKLSSDSKGTWHETTLYSFSGGTDGSQPNSTPFFYQGKLYGTTYGGGDVSTQNVYGYGVVFELSQSSGAWSESVLHAFQGSNDGYVPVSLAVNKTSGQIFGTTVYGGSASNGVAFEIVP